MRVEALLDGYWQNRPSDVVKEEIIADWMAGLEAFLPDEIRTACRTWQQDEPRRKPNVGDIRKVILSNRAKAAAKEPKPPAPEREREEYDPQAIFDEVGFKPKKFGPS